MTTPYVGIDLDTEPLTCAEVLAHHLGPVIDGNRDTPEPLIREQTDDLFKDGFEGP